MTHDDAIQRLPDLLGVHPAFPEEGALRAHVAECSACQERLATLQTIDAELRSFRDLEPSEDLDARIAAITQMPTDDEGTASVDSPSGPVGRQRPQRQWLQAVAASALALMIAVIALLAARPGGSEAFVAMNEMTMTASDPRVHATIAMGSPTDSNQPIRLEASGLSSTDAAYYTLWVMDDADHHMSAATFRPEGDGSCVVMGMVPRSAAWTKAAITPEDSPPGSGHMIAVARF